MAMIRKLAVLAGAAEAARRYAKNNPEQASKYLDQAAGFVDKQTKGRYSGQISGVSRRPSRPRASSGRAPTRGQRARACLTEHRCRGFVPGCAGEGRTRSPRPGGRARPETGPTPGHQPGVVRRAQEVPSVRTPTAWTPASVPTPEQVVAGLKATDEGGADLVQLLTPEGERVADERFDG